MRSGSLWTALCTLSGALARASLEQRSPGPYGRQRQSGDATAQRQKKYPVFKRSPLWRYRTVCSRSSQQLSFPNFPICIKVFFSLCFFFFFVFFFPQSAKKMTKKSQDATVLGCISAPNFGFLLSVQSLSGCSFFENRHNLIYMYRSFIYISYVCVFTGALLVGCSKQEVGRERRSNKCFFSFF